MLLTCCQVIQLLLKCPSSYFFLAPLVFPAFCYPIRTVLKHLAQNRLLNTIHWCKIQRSVEIPAIFLHCSDLLNCNFYIISSTRQVGSVSAKLRHYCLAISNFSRASKADTRACILASLCVQLPSSMHEEFNCAHEVKLFARILFLLADLL